MVDTSNNPIRPRPGSVTITPPRTRTRETKPAEENRREHMPPKLRGFTSEPKPDVLDALIERALKALQRGIFWDRGSILNLLV